MLSENSVGDERERAENFVGFRKLRAYDVQSITLKFQISRSNQYRVGELVFQFDV